MTSGVAPNLPSDVSAALDTFRAALEAAAARNLVALVVYGSVARGRYDPGSSDINVAIVLETADGSAVLQIAEVVHDAQRSSRIEPLIVAESELPRLAVSFPTKILDIQRSHRVLSGRDVFSGISVSRDDIRLRTEQELRNLALRLRRRLIAARNDGHSLALIADDTAAPLAVNLRALLYLRGKVPDEFQPKLAIYELAAAEFGLDGTVLDAILRVHKREERSVTAQQLGQLLDTVNRAADVAATFT
jgi:predicted nucleotidyltransferase